jgi:hypothetical protein
MPCGGFATHQRDPIERLLSSLFLLIFSSFLSPAELSVLPGDEWQNERKSPPPQPWPYETLRQRQSVATQARLTGHRCLKCIGAVPPELALEFVAALQARASMCFGLSRHRLRRSTDPQMLDEAVGTFDLPRAEG